MANTIKNVYTSGGLNGCTKYITIASDGTEETDYLAYDSSDAATTCGFTDTLDSTIMSVFATSSCASTARIKLEWDASTDVLALDIPAGQVFEKDFSLMGGLPNQGGSGKTGDILLTTTGLESGDTITLVLKIKNN